LNPTKEVSPFDTCKDVCRTHSGSVLNGNSFVSDFRFCFGRYIGLPPPPLPDGISVFAADQSVSCDDTCASKRLRCSADALPAVNSCSLLSKSFGCKSGCFSNVGSDQPAYVASQTDPLFGKCLMNSDPALFSCSGKHSSTRRLCPCI
jgi:hypothetical protein